ncbi:MAG: glycerol-3-phosphate 1-O-acyltransferase PlsY [Alphaproteobacteria bacterium]|nr:glycerol-3-phosphate 1-O-acyltransferase PlsY [Alphaproteobacteria bacterium]
MFIALLAAVCGYLLGSVPFGLLITKAAGLGDIRKIGSGNIGTTNVLRTGRVSLAIATLLADIGKAAVAAFLFKYFYSETMGLIAGVAAIFGHNFPIWLHFKGGKGVASTLGVLLVLTPWVGILTCLTWVAMAFAFHYSSLSAITALCLAPVYALFFATPQAALCYTFLTLLSLWRHRENIKRLIHGQESKISFKRKK